MIMLSIVITIAVITPIIASFALFKIHKETKFYKEK
jgi:hypothetical protein